MWATWCWLSRSRRMHRLCFSRGQTVPKRMNCLTVVLFCHYKAASASKNSSKNSTKRCLHPRLSLVRALANASMIKRYQEAECRHKVIPLSSPTHQAPSGASLLCRVSLLETCACREPKAQSSHCKSNRNRAYIGSEQWTTSKRHFWAILSTKGRLTSSSGISQSHFQPGDRDPEALTLNKDV